MLSQRAMFCHSVKACQEENDPDVHRQTVPQKWGAKGTASLRNLNNRVSTDALKVRASASPSVSDRSGWADLIWNGQTQKHPGSDFKGDNQYSELHTEANW